MARLMPFPIFRAFTTSDTLASLAGGKLYAYEPGTTTPKPIYSDPEGTVQHPSPLVLPASGTAVVYLAEGVYKILLTDANDVTQPGFPVENVQGLAENSIVSTIADLRAPNH